MKNNAIIGRDITTNKHMVIKENDRLFNTLILGADCSSKESISLKPMILNDMLEGNCEVILFEPNGDLAENIYNIANKRNKEVLYLSPNECKMSINPLAKDEHIVIRELLNVFNAIYIDNQPCFKNKCTQLLTNSIMVIKRVFGDNATFTELEMLIENIDGNGENILLELVKKSTTIQNLKLASWFLEYYEHNINCNDFIEAKKFIKFYTEDKYVSTIMNNIKNKNTVDIDTAIADGKHIVVGGNFELLKKENGTAFSMLLLEEVITALYNRINKDKPVYLYINEFSTYLSEQLIELLLVNRSLNVGIIVGLQSRGQIKKEYQNIIFSNIRNLIIHPGLNLSDADYFSKVFKNTIDAIGNEEEKEHMIEYNPKDIISKPFMQYIACVIEDMSYQLPKTLEGDFFKED